MRGARRGWWVIAVTVAVLAGGAPVGPAAPAPGPAKPVTLDLDSVPLEQAVEKWAAAAGQKVDVAWEGLASAGVGKSAPVTIRFRDVPADAALRLILGTVHHGRRPLATWREAGVIRVAAEDDQKAGKVGERTYDLGKLGLAGVAQADGGDPGECLTRLIMESVSPDCWRENGGPTGTVRVLNRALIVSATPAVQEEVAGLLDRLRGAVAERPAAIDPAAEKTRRALAVRLMAGRAPAAGRTTLAKALDGWRDAAPPAVNLLVDWRALEAAGVGKATEVVVPANVASLPAGEALGAILRAAGAGGVTLDWAVGDGGVVTVADRERLDAAGAEVRCYNVRALIARPLRRELAGAGAPASAAERLDAVVRVLMEAVDPTSWRDAGGAIGACRAFGPVLVIRQTRANHERVAAVLRAAM